MDIAQFPNSASYRRKPGLFAVEFAVREQVIATLEGPVLCREGDAIITGTAGERWPVPIEVFHSRYVARALTGDGESGQYQSLPRTVQAVQLSTPVKISLSAGRGQLAGSAGDWLVQHASGDCSVVREDIFRNTYERVVDR